MVTNCRYCRQQGVLLTVLEVSPKRPLYDPRGGMHVRRRVRPRGDEIVFKHVCQHLLVFPLQSYHVGAYQRRQPTNDGTLPDQHRHAHNIYRIGNSMASCFRYQGVYDVCVLRANIITMMRMFSRLFHLPEISSVGTRQSEQKQS